LFQAEIVYFHVVHLPARREERKAPVVFPAESGDFLERVKIKVEAGAGGAQALDQPAAVMVVALTAHGGDGVKIEHGFAVAPENRAVDCLLERAVPVIAHGDVAVRAKTVFAVALAVGVFPDSEAIRDGERVRRALFYFFGQLGDTGVKPPQFTFKVEIEFRRLRLGHGGVPAADGAGDGAVGKDDRVGKIGKRVPPHFLGNGVEVPRDILRNVEILEITDELGLVPRGVVAAGKGRWVDVVVDDDTGPRRDFPGLGQGFFIERHVRFFHLEEGNIANRAEVDGVDPDVRRDPHDAGQFVKVDSGDDNAEGDLQVRGLAAQRLDIFHNAGKAAPAALGAQDFIGGAVKADIDHGEPGGGIELVVEHGAVGEHDGGAVKGLEDL